MTYREKLAKEHPDKIDETKLGGCVGCPVAYGYDDEPTPGFCQGITCQECWDREIPEEKPDDKPVTHAVPSGLNMETRDETNPIYITVHTNPIGDPDAVIADVFKYVYTIKDRIVNISIQ